MFCTGRRSIKLWLFLVPALIMLLAGSAQSQSCGDFAAPLGVIDNDDWLYLYAYLYQGGPAPGDLSLGNTDCLGDITSNDLAEIANELFYGDGLSCCPIDANPPFPASSETIEFVNVAPPPWMGGEWTVEVWLWDEVPFWGLSLPFSIEGWPSPVTLLSVDFDIGEYTYYDTDGSSAGLIVMHGLNEPLVGGGRIARLNFWIHGYTNWIHLEPMESYSANHVLGLSTWTGFSVDPVTPNVYEAVPYGCGDFVSPMGPDPDDWITLFEYLYYGGEIMFGPMNMDCIGDITNNDLIELTRALMHGGPLDCCPTEPNPLFSQSTDTIEFREVMVPPGNSTWIVEVCIAF